MALTDTQLRQVYIAEVEPSFSGGIKWLINMVDILKQLPNNPNRKQLEAQVPPIRNAALETWRQFQQANAISTKHRKDVDRRVEELIQQISGFEREGDTARQELIRQEELLRLAEREAEEANRKVETMKSDMDRIMEQIFNLENSNPLTNAIGWLVSTMVRPHAVVMQLTGLNNQLDAVRSCFPAAVAMADNKQMQQREAAEKLEKRKAKVKQLQNKIAELKAKVSNLREEQKRCVERGEWIKNCSTYLEVALGKAEVMKGTTKSVYTFEPLINVLGNLVTHLDQGPGRLLAESCIQKLSLEKSALEQKIKAVDAVAEKHIYEDFA